MTETLYPWGYGRTMVTMAQLKQYARADLMEPEYAQRLFAWIASRGGQIGIGGAFRITQPTKPGFAPDGKSFHQSQEYADKLKAFSAVDLVVQNGANPHRAPTWAEVPRQGSGHPDIAKYGVHANVTGEPWHLQLIEQDGWQTWVNNGRKRPNQNFILPTTPAPTPPPVVTPPPTTTPTYKPGDRTLRLAVPTMKGPDVQWVQQTLKNQGLTISVDGYFGKQTRDRVMTMQGWNGLTKDGIVGPKTWAVLKKY